jgi:penicillin-binding protein 2
MIAILTIILFLFFRIWYLQVIRGRYYASLSENNRVRVVSLQPPRGMIYDRHGKLLVNNVPSFNLYLMLEDVQNREAVIGKLSRYVQLSPDEIQRRLTSPRYAVPYLPVRLKEGLSMKEVALIETGSTAGGIQAESQRNTPTETLRLISWDTWVKLSSSQMKNKTTERLPGSIVGQYGIDAARTVYSWYGGRKGIEVDAMTEMKTM